MYGLVHSSHISSVCRKFEQVKSKNISREMCFSLSLFPNPTSVPGLTEERKDRSRFKRYLRPPTVSQLASSATTSCLLDVYLDDPPLAADVSVEERIRAIEPYIARCSWSSSSSFLVLQSENKIYIYRRYWFGNEGRKRGVTLMMFSSDTTQKIPCEWEELHTAETRVVRRLIFSVS